MQIKPWMITVILTGALSACQGEQKPEKQAGTEKKEPAVSQKVEQKKEEPKAQMKPEVEAEPKQETRVTAENPDAILSDSSKLQADTLAAATHKRSESKIAYIGVWAGDASGCKQIDQDVYDSFAVITPKSVRQFEEACLIEAAQITSNVTVLESSCTAEGETRKGTIRIEMINGQSMMFSHDDGKPYPLTRCHLPR